MTNSNSPTPRQHPPPVPPPRLILALAAAALFTAGAVTGLTTLATDTHTVIFIASGLFLLGLSITPPPRGRR